ncbi:MAG: rhodanese-like domain-containing protein [Candidatus Marinimicrobia bacterium]|nr:rhodanese-like domain-containing protein [Candidatus Neomarinimicrobiota bacterium]
MKQYKNLSTKIVIGMGALFIFTVFLYGVNDTEYENISLTEVHERMESGAADYVLIDVRTLPEYTGPLGHLADAPLFPVQNLAENYEMLKSYQDKGQDMILYCRSGNRSGQAAKFLSEKGFENLYNMNGGMRAWNAKYGRPDGSDNPPPNK